MEESWNPFIFNCEGLTVCYVTSKYCPHTFLEHFT